MPVEIIGLKQTRTALRKFAPDLYKLMNAEIKTAMIPIRDKARGFVKEPNPGGLSSWLKGSGQQSDATHYRAFPTYNVSEIRSGIFYSQGFNKSNRAGFAVAYYVGNRSAAGAIYETAGRKNPNGMKQFQPGPFTPKGFHNTDHSIGSSRNPNAGKWFIDHLGELTDAKPRSPGQAGRHSRKHMGRLIFRAWAEDQGKVNAVVIRAIEKACADFNSGRLAA